MHNHFKQQKNNKNGRKIAIVIKNHVLVEVQMITIKSKFLLERALYVVVDSLYLNE